MSDAASKGVDEILESGINADKMPVFQKQVITARLPAVRQPNRLHNEMFC